MKILVIGGSYFLGRWFVQKAYKRHSVTVLNRGNIPIGLDGVTEIVADRHNDDELCKLESRNERYDAVVDFCAYTAGDIKQILRHLENEFPKIYIFVSTVDVYRKGGKSVISESFELAGAEDAGGDAAEYIQGKTELERELAVECSKYGIHGVSVRPAILYGPGNYAPRESIYIEWIRKAGQIIHPVDADGFFQMLYVSDAAEGLVKLCELPADELERAYNFCTDEIVTYDSFEEALAGACIMSEPSLSKEPFTRVDVSVATVLQRGIPLPFPLTESESCLYSGGLFSGLGVKITTLKEGLAACLKFG